LFISAQWHARVARTTLESSRARLLQNLYERFKNVESYVCEIAAAEEASHEVT